MSTERNQGCKRAETSSMAKLHQKNVYVVDLIDFELLTTINSDIHCHQLPNLDEH